MIILNVSGNITADAITRNVNGNTALAFTIASNEKYKKASGETVENVTFVRCTIWNKPEFSKLLFKGRAVNITGPLKVNRYTDKNGNQQINIDCKVSYLQVFGKGRGGNLEAETLSADNTNVTADDAAEAVKDLPF